MRTENLIAATANRARDMQSAILPFMVVHAVVLLAIVFGGSGLQADGVQLALATFAVLASIWLCLVADGAIAETALAAADQQTQTEAPTHQSGFARTQERGETGVCNQEWYRSE